ncbi:MAG TPA: hypothetical protein VKG01_15270 [Thermoanaerobaculia bacterium]|nr:hypothetical protein [Thermoanaerobaculia bacterium]
MADPEERRRLIEAEIERRLAERFAALREEFERLRRESDGRWSGFASRFEQKISGIVPVELLSADAPVERGESGRLSIEAARDLDSASSQVQILMRLLDRCRDFASRAALLVLKDGAFGVWRAIGLAGGAVAETAVRHVVLPANSIPLSRVTAGAPCRLSEGNEVSERLTCADAVAAVLVPIAIGDKISGALYADASPGGEDRFDPDSIALLAFLSGLLIERVAARKLRPSPSLRDLEHLAARTEGEPVRDDYDTQVASLWKEPPPPAPAKEEPPPEAAAPAPPTHAPEERRTLSGPLAPQDDEEKRVEARRFAELLVSEIKLYNERAVEEGRAEGNLYKRLKQEIDLTRQVYEQRIPASVREGSDYLREELVRILADGRPEALGF